MWWKRDKVITNQQVFFVRGFQRSGTNWISNLLNLHPDISCTGEFHLNQLFKAYKNTINKEYGLLKNKPNIVNKEFINFIDSLIIKYNNGNCKIVGDRTPMLISDLIIPNRKYILIQRDGRDVIVSWIYHLFRIDNKFHKPMEQRKLKFKNDENYFESNKYELLNKSWIERIAKNWNKRIISDLQTIEKAQQLDIEILSIKYEDLLLNTDSARREMYRFLRAEQEKALTLTDLTSPGFSTFNPKSHYRKGESGRWKLYFNDEYLNIFEKHASEALKALNYETHTC